MQWHGLSEHEHPFDIAAADCDGEQSAIKTIGLDVDRDGLECGAIVVTLKRGIAILGKAITHDGGTFELQSGGNEPLHQIAVTRLQIRLINPRPIRTQSLARLDEVSLLFEVQAIDGIVVRQTAKLQLGAGCPQTFELLEFGRRVAIQKKDCTFATDDYTHRPLITRRPVDQLQAISLVTPLTCQQRASA